MAWLFWPVSLAVMSRIGRYLLYGVAVLARVGGRYGPYWLLFCRVKRLCWPVSVAGMTRIGRYSPYEVAAMARIGGRYEP